PIVHPCIYACVINTTCNTCEKSNEATCDNYKEFPRNQTSEKCTTGCVCIEGYLENVALKTRNPNEFCPLYCQLNSCSCKAGYCRDKTGNCVGAKTCYKDCEYNSTCIQNAPVKQATCDNYKEFKYTLVRKCGSSLESYVEQCPINRCTEKCPKNGIQNVCTDECGKSGMTKGFACIHQK
ncbi:hypothetical protein B4U80_14029, partial [Leptotrombidium deliense]